MSLESRFCESRISVGFGSGKGDSVGEGSGFVAEELEVVVGVVLKLGAGAGDSVGSGFVLVPRS